MKKRNLIVLLSTLVMVFVAPALLACGSGGKCDAKIAGGKAVKVTGMMCSACETKVAKAAMGVKGVEEAKACAKCGVLFYKGKNVDMKALTAAVSKAGFKVSAKDKSAKATCSHKLEGAKVMKVSGMMCSACANKVTKAALSVKGVEKAEACVKCGALFYLGKDVDQGDLAAAVKKAGFKPNADKKA